MKPSKYAAYCPTCGREYAFPIKQFGGEKCIDCGRELLPLKLPKVVRMRRAKEKTPLSGGTEQQRKELTQDQYNQIGRILQA